MKFKTSFILIFLYLGISLGINAQDAYVTPSGERYHLYSCRHVNNVSKKLSIYKAVSNGYTPCKICKPPHISSSSINPLNKPNKAVGSCYKVRCRAIAKSTGNRCKRKTSLCNGFCFQHNPKK